MGVKAEVEKSKSGLSASGEVGKEGVLGLGDGGGGDVDMEGGDEGEGEDGEKGKGKGEDSWLEIAIEIPGMRDDDALPVFLSAMLTEALLADAELRDRLWINRRFHWRLYVDVSILNTLGFVHFGVMGSMANGEYYRSYYSLNHSPIRSLCSL